MIVSRKRRAVSVMVRTAPCLWIRQRPGLGKRVEGKQKGGSGQVSGQLGGSGRAVGRSTRGGCESCPAGIPHIWGHIWGEEFRHATCTCTCADPPPAGQVASGRAWSSASYHRPPLCVGSRQARHTYYLPLATRYSSTGTHEQARASLLLGEHLGEAWADIGLQAGHVGLQAGHMDIDMGLHGMCAGLRPHRTAHCSLLTTHRALRPYSPRATHHALLTTHHAPLTTLYLLLTHYRWRAACCWRGRRSGPAAGRAAGKLSGSGAGSASVCDLGAISPARDRWRPRRPLAG
eukprot:scaffold76134_cov62-Phaeocystis_antarctica.AAC.3